MSIKRNVILHDFAGVVDALYENAPAVKGH
jgi:hypothetical protein